MSNESTDAQAPKHEHTEYFYSNKHGRIYLIAIEDVIGKNGLNAVLNYAGLSHLVNNLPPNNLERQFKFADFAGVNQAIEDMYGVRGGRGLNLRAGRAVFKYGLQDFAPVLGLADLAFKILPLPMKMKTGLPLFAEVFNRFTDQVVRVEEDEKHFYWHIDLCPVCWGRTSEKPCCHVALGLIQEALHWVSGGKSFRIRERSCIACGDERCTFVVTKRPLD